MYPVTEAPGPVPLKVNWVLAPRVASTGGGEPGLNTAPAGTGSRKTRAIAVAATIASQRTQGICRSLSIRAP